MVRIGLALLVKSLKPQNVLFEPTNEAHLHLGANNIDAVTRYKNYSCNYYSIKRGSLSLLFCCFMADHIDLIMVGYFLGVFCEVIWTLHGVWL